MSLLNTADDVKLGASQVDKVYLGVAEVWVGGSTPSGRTTITIENTGALKTNHPVKVTLTASTFDFTPVQSDGFNISFESTDGLTVLPHWTESFNKSGESAEFWVKVPSLAAAGLTHIDLVVDPLTVTVDPSSISDVFLIGADFRTLETGMAAIGGDGTESAPSLGNHLLADPVPLINHGGTGWRRDEVREQSNIVWTGTEFVLLVTGKGAGTTSGYAVGLLYASDILGPWTEYSSNGVLPNAEDPYITMNTDGTPYVDGSGWYYVTFERKPAQADIGIARTKNFRTDWEVWNGSIWSTTTTAHVAVLVRGAASAWDETFTGSPTVVHDGSQFICVYEGSGGASVDATGVARSADGITWTKEATNPILAVDVIDDLRLVGSTWWAYFHGTGGDQSRYKTTAAPSAWSSSSFTADPAAEYIAGGNSINLAFGFDGCEKWVTYQDGFSGSTLGIQLRTWIGGDWTSASDFKRSTASLLPTGGFRLSVDVLEAAFSRLSTVATPLTSGFLIAARRKQTVGVSGDDQFAQIAIGSGATFTDSGHMYYADGYTFELTNAEQYIQIRKATSSAFVNTTFTADVTTAEAQAYNLHEMVYLADGTLDYRVAGRSRVSRNDSAHIAASKGMTLVQSSPVALTGGISTYEYAYARPYDGTDPNVGVGSVFTPVNTVAPAISGSAMEGATLSTTSGTWTSPLSLTYSYQWTRGGVDISGATSATYLVVPDDIGELIGVTVTATNATASASASAATVGPIAVWSPLALTGLAAWYDASDAATLTVAGGKVSAWTDKSGNGKTLTQATSGSQPSLITAAQNGRDVVRFTASDDFMANASVTLGAVTFIAVVKATAAGIIVEHGTNANTTAGTFLYSTVGSTMVTRRSTRSVKDASPSTWLTSPASAAKVVFVQDGTHAGLKLYKNGTEVTTATAGGLSTDIGTGSVSASLNVGARAGGTFGFSGDICELFVMSAAITSDERSRIETYLGRWFA